MRGGWTERQTYLYQSFCPEDEGAPSSQALQEPVAGVQWAQWGRLGAIPLSKAVGREECPRIREQ